MPAASRIQFESLSTPCDRRTANPAVNFYLDPTTLIPPRHLGEFFEQATGLRIRRLNKQPHKLRPIWKGLQSFLCTFADPREIGIKFPDDDKPRHILTTEKLNQRIADNNRGGFLSNLELHHHYARHYRLYYCCRHDSPYIYPYLDFDSKGHQGYGDTQEAVEFVKTKLGITGFDQPSTNGWPDPRASSTPAK
jgi:hypothetical protein